MVACRDVGIEPCVALEIETLARDKRLSPKDSAFALIPRWHCGSPLGADGRLVVGPLQ